MHRSELTTPEQRVLGCLVEKRWTTPEQYPLSLNSLRLACNQSTNRDPVTAYDEATVREAAQRLSKYGLTRLASGHNSRAVKYRHLGEEGLSLDRPQLALLAILLLRGAQTPGELKARSERLAPIESLDEVQRLLDELDRRGYARRLPRRPGHKEDRFEHLLGGAGEDAVDDAAAVVATAAASPDSSLEHRVVALEGELHRLRSQLGVRFSLARLDAEPGQSLVGAMRDEIAALYPGVVLDGPDMPKAGPAQLGPPGGAFVVGRLAGRPVCCGGVKRLDDQACELKRMYVVPEARRAGLGRVLLHELEDRARGLGYVIARLDTGPRQGGSRRLYESEGYVEVANFNANPVAAFWGEKPLI